MSIVMSISHVMQCYHTNKIYRTILTVSLYMLILLNATSIKTQQISILKT